MGPDTLQIPMEMFQENRAKVCNAIKPSVAPNSIILLEGGQDISWYDTDVSYNFKQVCCVHLQLVIKLLTSDFCSRSPSSCTCLA